MPTILIGKGEDRHSVEADIHNDYLVIPNTKIPLLNNKLLEALPNEQKQKILSQIETAKTSDKALIELWKSGDVLRYAYERPQAKFVYTDFLQKIKNRDFEKHPVKNAFSPLERQYLPASFYINDFSDKPDIIMNLLRSLPQERLDNLLNSNSRKIANFIIDNGTTKDMDTFLSLVPEEKRENIITQNNYDILLRASGKNRQDMLETIVKYLSKEKQNYALNDLHLEILKDSSGDEIHPSFNEKVYSEMLPITFAACKAEGRTGAIGQAYKLAVLFPKSGMAMSYLEKWTDPKRNNSRDPVHDALYFDLPEIDAKYDTKAWAKLAIEHGTEALKYFRRADRIEEALSNLSKFYKENNIPAVGIANAHPRDLTNSLTMFEYDDFMKNPKWGYICAQHDVNERVFNKGLKILEQPKTTDNTPDIGIIDGKDIGESGYYMRKLAPTDPKNLLIGRMVNCCNHIDGGATDEMAISHVISPDAACYVIFKQDTKGKINDFLDKPVAKATGWMSMNNNLVFNSWERLDSEYSHLCEPFFSEAGKRILENNPEIARVLLGHNRDRIEKFIEVSDPERPRSINTSSGDSDYQYLIAQQERSVELNKIINKKLNMPEFSLWDKIIEETSNLGLSSTQTHRIHKKLAKIRPEIEKIEEYAKETRQMIIEAINRHGEGWERREAIQDIGQRYRRETIDPLKSIYDYLKDVQVGYLSIYEYSDEGRKKATGFINNVAIKHFISDLIYYDDETSYKPSGYEYSMDTSKEAISDLGGSRSLVEYAKEEPRKFAAQTAFALSLYGIGSGLSSCSDRESAIKEAEKAAIVAEEERRENEAVKAESENPNIFRGSGDSSWHAQFKEIDISNPEELRSKFGNEIEINGVKMPVEVFAVEVAPALNTLEEIKKGTPPDKWNIKKPASYSERIETEPQTNLER